MPTGVMKNPDGRVGYINQKHWNSTPVSLPQPESNYASICSGFKFRDSNLMKIMLFRPKTVN